uniref:Small ribosomal subunit protein bS16m n=1 Tax=Globodera rostochiensis TaxID=31243 RepID=A0A914HP39_GLORO
MRQLVNPRTFGRPCISLASVGCANRPAYHINVFPDKALGRRWEGNVIENLGSFDPLPNDRNEKLVAMNIERLKYWLGVRNAHVSPSALELLGLSGLLPVHPRTFLRARMNRIQRCSEGGTDMPIQCEEQVEEEEAIANEEND